MGPARYLGREDLTTYVQSRCICWPIMDTSRCEPKGTDPSWKSRDDLLATSERSQLTGHLTAVRVLLDLELLRHHCPYNTIPTKHPLLGQGPAQVEVSWL